MTIFLLQSTKMSNSKLARSSKKRSRGSAGNVKIEPPSDPDTNDVKVPSNDVKIGSTDMNDVEGSAKKAKVGPTEIGEVESEVSVDLVKRASGMLLLPDELLLLIGKFLNLVDLSNFSKANKRLCKAINTHNGSWNRFFEEFRLTRSSFIDKTVAGNYN